MMVDTARQRDELLFTNIQRKLIVLPTKINIFKIYFMYKFSPSYRFIISI